MIEDAERTSWREVVQERFQKSNPELHRYITDLNRATWVTVLPVSPDGVVLDVGCGLGAISHSLAQHYRKVVSLEPVAERIHWSNLRMRQENLDNVEFVMGPLEKVPFAENAFDAIVLNGVLEWAGEFDRNGSPREAQIKMLRHVFRLLKPGGVVVIGIENRIGYSTFNGRIDHSGLPYTNLLPRRLASWVLQLNARLHYRTERTGVYRTYTYAKSGFSRLLREAGFPEPEVFCPYPGYNCPVFLFPWNDPREVNAFYFNRSRANDRMEGPSLWRRIVRWLINRGWFHYLSPDFIIIGRKLGQSSREDIASSIREQLEKLVDQSDGCSSSRPAQLSVHSYPGRKKWVIRVADHSGTLRFVAKVGNTISGEAALVEHEHKILQSLAIRIGANRAIIPSLSSTIPVPCWCRLIGHDLVAVETAVPGVLWQDLINEPGYFDNPRRVEAHLALMADWMIRFYQSLPGYHHGDLTVANVLIDESKGCIGVIDWERMDYTLPPLFDWFLLVTSIRFVADLPVCRTEEDMIRLSFRNTHLEKNWFSDLAKKTGVAIAQAAGFSSDHLGEAFVQFLKVSRSRFEGRLQIPPLTWELKVLDEVIADVVMKGLCAPIWGSQGSRNDGVVPGK